MVWMYDVDTLSKGREERGVIRRLMGIFSPHALAQANATRSRSSCEAMLHHFSALPPPLSSPPSLGSGV